MSVVARRKLRGRGRLAPSAPWAFAVAGVAVGAVVFTMAWTAVARPDSAHRRGSTSSPAAGKGCVVRFKQRDQAVYVRAVYKRPRITVQARRRLARMRRCARSPRAAGNMRRMQTAAGHARARRQRVTPYAGPGGPWAIPWPIVRCESNGRNLSPNGATASGYYQFITPTWAAMGGTGAAWQAPRETQDRIAARLWAGGHGARHWDCAGLVAW